MVEIGEGGNWGYTKMAGSLLSVCGPYSSTIALGRIKGFVHVVSASGYAYGDGTDGLLR